MVYPGRKPESPYDFIVRFKEPGKRERTPAHVHLIVEMYVKYAYNPSLTLKLKEHILTMFKSIKPISSFPPSIQFFKQEHVEPLQGIRQSRRIYSRISASRVRTFGNTRENKLSGWFSHGKFV